MVNWSHGGRGCCRWCLDGKFRKFVSWDVWFHYLRREEICKLQVFMQIGLVCLVIADFYRFFVLNTVETWDNGTLNKKILSKIPFGNITNRKKQISSFPSYSKIHPHNMSWRHIINILLIQHLKDFPSITGFKSPPFHIFALDSVSP